MEPRLTHVDERGAARIVDITGKTPTERRAVARGWVRLAAPALEVLRVTTPVAALETARIAALSAAKRTSQYIPLCHPIHVDDVAVAFAVMDYGVEVRVVVRTLERTGPEMEALVACSVAALSIAGSFKHTEPKPVLDGIVLLEKSGGKSGTWLREQDAAGDTGAARSPAHPAEAPHTEAS